MRPEAILFALSALAAPLFAQDPVGEPPPEASGPTTLGEDTEPQEVPPAAEPDGVGPEDETAALEELEADDERPLPRELRPKPAFYAYVGYGFNDLGYGEGELGADLEAASGIDASVNSVDDSDGGIKFAAGYWVHERVAIELGFVDFGTITSDFEFTGAPGSEAVIEQAIRDEHPFMGSGFTGAVRALLLDGTRFDVSAKLGLLVWESENEFDVEFNGTPLDIDGDESGADVFYGLGLHYDVAEDWAVQLEGDLYRIENETNAQISLGVRYAFDL